MTKLFTPKADWRYSWRDIADASTPDELNRASYGCLLHRLLPVMLPTTWGLAFILFGKDSTGALAFVESMKREPKWSWLMTEVIEVHSMPVGDRIHVVVAGPIGPDAVDCLPLVNRIWSHYAVDFLFSELGLKQVCEDLGGIFIETEDRLRVEGGIYERAVYGVAAISGIREVIHPIANQGRQAKQ